MSQSQRSVSTRGSTAVIRSNAVVFDFGTWQLKGRPAWLLWASVHGSLMVNLEKRLLDEECRGERQFGTINVST